MLHVWFSLICVNIQVLDRFLPLGSRSLFKGENFTAAT